MQASPQGRPAVVFAEEGVRVGAGPARDGEVAEAALVRPIDEGGQEIVGLGSRVEPAIEVGLCGGGQGLAVSVEPGQEVQGDSDLGADVGGGVPGDRPVSRSIPGPSQRLPGCEGPQQFRVVLGLFAQQVVQPDVDAVEQLGAFGKDSGVDKQVSGSVQGITLRISIEEFVGDGFGVGAKREFAQQARSTAAFLEPVHDVRGPGNGVEDPDQRCELVGNSVVGVGEQVAELVPQGIVSGLVRSPPGPVRRLGQARLEDVPGVPAWQANRLAGKGIRWIKSSADQASAFAAGAAAAADVRLLGACAAVHAPDVAAGSAAPFGPLVAALADRPLVGVGVGRGGPFAAVTAAFRCVVAVRAERCPVVAAGRDAQQPAAGSAILDLAAAAAGGAKGSLLLVSSADRAITPAARTRRAVAEVEVARFAGAAAGNDVAQLLRLPAAQTAWNDDRGMTGLRQQLREPLDRDRRIRRSRDQGIGMVGEMGFELAKRAGPRSAVNEVAGVGELDTRDHGRDVTSGQVHYGLPRLGWFARAGHAGPGRRMVVRRACGRGPGESPAVLAT